mmetsp:Transcript_23389/g.35445  ORF Transcript_23389/g.35445 Transcript_23389/m.35445 type:complete len:141 (-) Transcript_23389:5022-5444(-)
MKSLLTLFGAKSPPVWLVRSRQATEFFYGFRDASGSSFWASFELNGAVECEYGYWCTEDSEESSNWRELSNLVSAVKNFVKKHVITNSEIFIFTDNTTAEQAFWKGTSCSRKLFELVLELRQLTMRSAITIHMVHVSGSK